MCLLPVPETPLENVRFIDKYTHILLFGGYAWVLWCESACIGAVLCAKVVWNGSPFFQPLATSAHRGLACAVRWAGRSAASHADDLPFGRWLDFLADAFGVLLALAAGIPTYRFPCALNSLFLSPPSNSLAMHFLYLADDHADWLTLRPTTSDQAAPLFDYDRREVAKGGI